MAKKKTRLSDFEPIVDKKTTLRDFEPNIDNCVVYPLIPKGLTGILAMPGHLKSWLIAQLVIDISLGKKYLQKYDTNTREVIYIDEDSPTDVYNSRLERCARYYGEDYNKLPITKMSKTGFDITKKTTRENLVDKVLQYKANSIEVLTVIDCLGSVCGGIDMNRPENATRVMGYLSEIGSYGTDIIITHHVSLKKEFKIDLPEPAKYVMGSTHIIGGFDNTIYAYKPDIIDRTVTYIRPVAKRSTIPVGIFGIELFEDLPDKITASLRQIDDMPSVPTEDELSCFKVMPKGNVEVTTWDIEKRLGGYLRPNDIRDCMITLVKEKVAIVHYYDKSSSAMTYSINPDLLKIKTVYVEALMKV